MYFNNGIIKLLMQAIEISASSCNNGCYCIFINPFVNVFVQHDRSVRSLVFSQNLKRHLQFTADDNFKFYHFFKHDIQT